MQFWEGLPMSWAKKVEFQVDWRDIYVQEWPPSDYYLFFESGKTDNSPIILLWDWVINDQTQSLIETINKKIILKWNICTFITKDTADTYIIQVHEKIHASKLPLVLSEPVHSTESVWWKLKGMNEILIKSIETTTGKIKEAIIKIF